jgi:putative nucleotidyltransferase with HDIG domain
MIRILFVDDEVNVIQAMRRTLHSMRSEWQMEFVSSGAEGLAALATCPADVVVSDMRMPGMDGWQFLSKVKELYPQTVRLILSGHADPSSIMRAVGTTHQYLAKPCESTSLKAAITQTQKLRSLVSSDQLAALVGDVGMLPSVPAAFQDLLACLRRPNASLVDASKIIARDVAMTANIMKLVNSAFFGARQTIRTIDRAVAYLGLDTLGALVLGHNIFQGGIARGIKEFNLEGLWDHSLKTAALARSIALYESFSEAQAAEAFLAAVLHDIGKLVFAARAVSPQAASCVPSDDLACLMEEHHGAVGAYLLGLWGFPNSIVEAVAFHHAPKEAQGSGLTLPSLLHIADRMCHGQSDGQSEATEFGIEKGLLESLGLASHLAEWTQVMNDFEAVAAAI